MARRKETFWTRLNELGDYYKVMANDIDSINKINKGKAQFREFYVLNAKRANQYGVLGCLLKDRADDHNIAKLIAIAIRYSFYDLKINYKIKKALKIAEKNRECVIVTKY